MKKLFIIVNVDWFFLSHRKEIALSAREKGYDVTIVTKDTGKASIIKDLGLKFIELPMNSVGMNPIEEYKTFRFLNRLYKKEKPDIVHHVGLKAILWGSLAAKRTKVKGVLNAISGLGVFFAEDNKSILSSLIVFVLRYSHKRKNIYTIFQNSEDEELFLKTGIINKSNVVFIKGSGVDLNIFKYVEEPKEGKIKVVLTARMIKDKGIFVLTEAAEILREAYGDKVQFLLCGGLDKNPNAIKEVDLKNVCDDNYICWLGYCSNVKEILEGAHIVTLPSYYKEGLPKSLIEATAIGRPIITTNSIGCKDTVIDGYSGFLIPIKDSISLANKLRVLFDDKSLRIEMGKNSRLYAEKYFSLENVVNTHLSVYEKLLEL